MSATTQESPDVMISLRDRGALSTTDAALYLGVGVSTMRKWRLNGDGPAYARVGSSILYRPTDLR